MTKTVWIIRGQQGEDSWDEVIALNEAARDRHLANLREEASDTKSGVTFTYEERDAIE